MTTDYSKPYAANGGKPTFQSFITPVGKVVHCYHDKPQLEVHEKTRAPILDENGIQKANYKITLAWPKSELLTSLMPLRQLMGAVRDEAWGPGAATDNWFRLESPLRDGDNPEHNTKRREYLFGHVYMNFKQKATPQKQPDGRVVYTGGPQIIGPYNEDLLPVDMFAGCEARVSGIMFGTHYSGRNFISTRLNNVQKGIERPGFPFVRMQTGGERPDAKSQFEPLAQGAPGGVASGLPNFL